MRHAASVNHTIQRDIAFQKDGPWITKVPPYPHFCHYEPELNRKPAIELELELELIQTQMTQKPILRKEVGMRVCCANKASAE